MAGGTKMIIITSNEDLIRQLSSKKTTNTRIIDLDDQAQAISLNKDNNVIDLTFLAELSELNSTSDQTYKRALDTPHYNRSKSSKLSKKTSDAVCTICGDRAIGSNYDVLSCASCKAFFRRNAYQSLEKLRCLTNSGQCPFTHETRRKCTRCRLDRCFAVGMRKDFILTDEEKQRRKQRLEENRNSSLQRISTSETSDTSLQILPKSETLPETFDEIDQLLMDMNKDDDIIHLDDNLNLNALESVLFNTLPVEDCITIDHLRSSFLSIFERKHAPYQGIDVADLASALLSWSEFANELALKFINFFRQIDEFENLHNDDRFLLVKYNLLPLFSIFKCYSYQSGGNDCISNENNGLCEQKSRFHALCGGSKEIQDRFANLIRSLVEITGQDPTLLSLLIATLLFSRGLSMNVDEPPLNDSLAAYRAQSHYATILWNYLISRWGEVDACKHYCRLMTVNTQIQSLVKTYREFLRGQFMISNIVDRMAPLMQTVLQI